MEIKILAISKYIIPLYGNSHSQPYGKVIVEFAGTQKETPIREKRDGKQYIIVNRKQYFIKNIGTLYSPRFIINKKPTYYMKFYKTEGNNG